MAEIALLDPIDFPDISNLVLEDNTPLDSFINEKQQRLLTTVFYSGADTGITDPFIAAANVGLFSSLRQPGIAPDMFLSMNIDGDKDWWERQVRSYLFWEFGKPPEVVIEVISPTPGNELGSKLIDYARMRILYYVVYDPLQRLHGNVLQVFRLQGVSYIPMNDAWFPEVGLGLTLWQGEFENINATWLRWCYANGNPMPTGDELITQKDVELSQIQAQLSQSQVQLTEEQARTRQAFLLAIELGLNLKFGEAGVAILGDISAISDISLLQRIASSLSLVNSLDEIRKMI